MGLRERNQALTSELILDTALALFLEQGYDATTMEEIAEQAQIGTSTLYRYFPTKDMLVTDPIALHGQLAAELRARPTDEPLDLALGHALRALIATSRPHPVRLRQIFTVLESAAGPRARLRHDFDQEQALLQQAVAERMGRPTDDLFCVMTARITILVLEFVGDGAAIEAAEPSSTTAEAGMHRLSRVMELLSRQPPVLPRLA